MTLYSNQQYYEAKLQIRPYNEEIISYAKELIDKNSNILIVKEQAFKYGIDFLTTSQKETQNIAKQLKKRFKGTITLSRKLFGVSKLTSKKIYRVTVCFRIDKN
jgi:NMD protein affecting ribosome stability and mRNA decay